MTQLNFGTKNQLSFIDEGEFYETLGFLSKSSGITSIHWEENEKSGAWGSEGRIHCYKEIDNFPIALKNAFTSGVGNIIHRINCNEFIEYIVKNHNFTFGSNQNITLIRSTIPTDYTNDFENGLNK